MAYLSWQALERQTYSLLNKLLGEDLTQAEMALTTTAALTNLSIADEAFPLAKVRWNIVLAHQGAIALICKEPGHHRRVEYRKLINLQHGEPVPSSLGPRVFTWKDPSDSNNFAKRRTLQRRQASVIDELRADPASLRGAAALYYDLRGSVFVCSVDDVIECEYYDFTMPAKHPSEVAALFGSVGNLASIADEFVSPVCNVAAGMSALTIASGSVAAAFFEAAKQEYEAQGLSVPEADYQTWRRPQRQ